MNTDKIISYIDVSDLRGSEKGTSKGLIVSCQTDGLRKDSNAYMYSFLQFTFSDDLQIKSVGKEVIMYNEETIPEDVKTPWMKNTENRVAIPFSFEILQKLLLGVEVVVAHNASFVYHFLSKEFGKAAFRSLPFGCTMKGINFSKKGINTLALEFIAYKYDLWYNPTEETTALLQILTLDDNFSELVERIFLSSNTITLNNTSFKDKDNIKSLGYNWNPDGKNWYKNGVDDASEEEDKLKNLGVYCSVDVTPVSPEEKYKTEGI